MSLKSVDLVKATLQNKGVKQGGRLDKNRTRSSIESMLEEHLKNPGEVLVFEALPNALDHTISVIEEPPLNIKYDIVQIDETLFQASLKEIDILDGGDEEID